jgi:alpha-1,6-mannosyltransferase
MNQPPRLSIEDHLVQNWLLMGSALLLAGGAVLMSANGNFSQVTTLHRFWLSSAIMGGGFVLSWQLRSLPSVWFWGVAIAARLLLLPMVPGDDVWRYLWEGLIQTHGFSPFSLPPNAPELASLRTDWWPLINFPDVSAIYPPLSQFGFRLLATVSPNLYLFKLAFVAADLLVCWLLSRRFGNVAAALYAWNPMIIYTFAGGAHYDSWFILPMVVAWFAAEDKDATPRPSGWLWGALWVGVSLAVKWMSLPLLAFFVGRSLLEHKVARAIGIGLVGLLPMVLFALPFCSLTSCPLIPTSSMFVSYGRSAEFLPHFLALVWPSSLKANWIYGVPLALYVLWLGLRTKRFQPFAEAYWFGLLLLTPIVHFWYFTWMVPFAVPNQNWGVRWVSLSAFIYFVLPSRLPDWRLTEPERLLLWLPFIVGWFWTWQTMRNQSRIAGRELDLRR